MPTLFLVPTSLSPDSQETILSPQVKETVQQISVFFVENIRTARRFISSLKLGKEIDNLTFYELTKDTPFDETYLQLRSLTTDAAVLSEAGCPGVADPGAVAVGFAHELGWKVAPLVGPSSILLALMGSGFSGQNFTFHGYLPIDKIERNKAFKKLESLAVNRTHAQIFMETPFRNNQLLAAILQVGNPTTRLCIAANLTANNELISTKTIAHWRMSPPDLHKIPTIFIVG